MNASLAIAQLLIQLLPVLQTGVMEAINYINAVRAAGNQTGEWTPEIDAAFRESLKATGNDAAYQPDTA